MPLPPKRRPIAACLCPLAVVLACVSDARALPAVPDTRGQVAMVAPDGLAGGRYVGSARVPDQALRVGAGAAYAYTESVLGAGDGHHRVQLDLAGALTIAPWLQVSARVALRHDEHTGRVHDQGTAGDTVLHSRHQLFGAGRAALAVGTALLFPAAGEVGRSLRATSIAAELIGSLAVGKNGELAATLGYRVERSAKALREPARLSAADRLGSLASDDDAVFTGLSVSRPLGPVLGMLEWSWELYGQGPNDALDGPMRLRAAFQKRLGERFTPGMEFAVRTGRPPAFTGVMRIEPLLWAGFTLAISLDDGAGHGAPKSLPGATNAAAAAPRAESLAQAAEPRRASSELQGAVRAEGARAVLASVDVLELNETIHTDDQGRFRLSVEPGNYTLRVSATGYESEVRRAHVDPDGVTILVIELTRSR